MKGLVFLAVLMTTALLVGAQDPPGSDPGFFPDPDLTVDTATPTDDYEEKSPAAASALAAEFPTETPATETSTGSPPDVPALDSSSPGASLEPTDASVDEPVPTTTPAVIVVDSMVAATDEVPLEEAPVTEEAGDLKEQLTLPAAEQEVTAEKRVEEPTHWEVEIAEEVPTTVVTAAQEQEIATESLVPTTPSDAELPEQVPGTPTSDEPEDVDPTEAPAPEDSPTVNTVPATTAAPISTTTRPPVMIRTIKPTVPVATDREDLDEDPVKPIYAAKPGRPWSDAVTPAPAIRAEVPSYKPNPKVWKPAVLATEAHKAKPKQPRDADESAPAYMPGHTAADHGPVTGLNETAHNAHGDHAEGHAETSSAQSTKAFFGATALALALALH